MTDPITAPTDFHLAVFDAWEEAEATPRWEGLWTDGHTISRGGVWLVRDGSPEAPVTFNGASFHHDPHLARDQQAMRDLLADRCGEWRSA